MCKSYCVERTISIFQVSKVTWTTGSPLAFQDFNKGGSHLNNWKFSWDVYIKFLEWYHQELKKYKYFMERATHVSKFLGKGNKLFTSDTKAKMINSLIRNNSTGSTLDCVMMLLWHKTYTHWINIPCDTALLDTASVFCINSQKMQTSQHTNTGFKVNEKPNPNKVGLFDISNLFLCGNSSYISSQFLCDGKPHCKHEEDELLCKTNISNIDIKMLLFKFEDSPFVSVMILQGEK